jgi:hypothetical protein
MQQEKEPSTSLKPLAACAILILAISARRRSCSESGHYRGNEKTNIEAVRTGHVEIAPISGVMLMEGAAGGDAEIRNAG